MMMPANYSVIAENEMTYVVGGGLVETLGKYTAPIWDDKNVKTFNTNLVTIVGNAYLGKFLSNTVAYVFSGNATWKGIGQIPKNLFGGFKGQPGDAVANALGITAAIYNLGRTDVKNAANDTIGFKLAK